MIGLLIRGLDLRLGQAQVALGLAQVLLVGGDDAARRVVRAIRVELLLGVGDVVLGLGQFDRVLTRSVVTRCLSRVELLLSGGLGGSLVTKLKEARTLVVAVSPLAAEDVSEALGADAFLQKPIDPVILLSTVRDLLGTSALTAVRTPSAS